MGKHGRVSFSSQNDHREHGEPSQTGKQPTKKSQKVDSKRRKDIKKIEQKIEKLEKKMTKDKSKLKEYQQKKNTLQDDGSTNQPSLSGDTARIALTGTEATARRNTVYEEKDQHMDFPDEDIQQSDTNDITSKEHNATLENYNRQQLEGMEKLEQNLKDNENRCIDLQYQLNEERERGRRLRNERDEATKKAKEYESKHRTLLKNEHQTLQRELTSLKGENEHLKKKYTTLLEDTGKSMQRETELDSTQTENISQKCRPSVIAEEYYNLSFQRASQIKTSLTHKHGTKWKQVLTNYMCNLYVLAGDRMKNRYSQVIDIIAAILARPMSTVTQDVSGKTETSSGYLSSETKHYIMETLKNNSQDIDMKDVTQTIKHDAFGLLQNELKGEPSVQWKETLTTDEDMYMFAESVCRLAWQMALQQPAMRWDVSGIGEKPDEDRQDVIPSNNKKERKNKEKCVIHYLEPTLVHGDQILAKGRVVVE